MIQSVPSLAASSLKALSEGKSGGDCQGTFLMRRSE